MNDGIYTVSERTVKKYTVYQAVQSAERRIKGRFPMCMNAVGSRQMNDKITLKELNELSDALYSDSVYYAS